MGRSQSGCARCGGQTRQQSSRNLVGVCPDCMGQICAKHWVWNSSAGYYVCSACNRKRG